MNTHDRLVSLLHALAPAEGYNLSPLPGVRFLRSNRPLARTPVLYDPGIVFVCQGRKRGHWGHRTYLYDAQHYLVVSVPVPFTMESDGSPTEPLLAIYFHLDYGLAADLMLQLDQFPHPVETCLRGMVATPMEAALEASVLRLVEALSSPIEAALLGPSLLREVYFRVLTGSQGGVMRAALVRHGNFGKVGRAIRMIHDEFDRPLDVDRLALAASMSAPSLHLHFKAVTQASPMQYLKSIRLHQARLLMSRQGMTAAAASAKVGYESPSQFSREFKRLFGRPPAEEVKRMRASFSVPPAQGASRFVASH